MSQRKRRGKPPSERRRERETKESQQFRYEMTKARMAEMGLPGLISGLVKQYGAEFAAEILGRPCIVCDRPNPEDIGSWLLSPETARKCGVPDGKSRAYLYRICRECASKTGAEKRWAMRFLEAKIIAIERGEN